ncbi:T-cell surface antigen CD2-like isoform X2 [Syngnathus acus]|uniref:T-cell surface antigen CD2-like isoform X2 n=1 Tax=Syngnathus acus TaxID=161584 RepID=UPI001885BE67|nr:T-cell surface antigen CD2-like isoform X2 [Syngnathus acus]
MRFWLLRQEITFILPSSCSSCQSAMKLKVMVRILPSSIVSLLLLGCRLTCADSQDACEAYALIGGNFNVPLYHNLQKSEKLRWIHNKTKIFDQRNDKVVIGKPNDILQNGSLKLTNLKRNSEGTYVPEVYDVKGKLLTDAKKLYLCVLDPVSKPGLKVECALPNVKFTCTSDQIQKAIVEWFQNGKLLPQKNQPTVLQIVQNVKHDLFTCKVSNRLSSMSSEAVKQNCTDSSSIFPKELFGLDFKIMVSILAGIGGLALLLIIILIVCCVRAIREKRKRAKGHKNTAYHFNSKNIQHIHSINSNRCGGASLGLVQTRKTATSMSSSFSRSTRHAATVEKPSSGQWLQTCRCRSAGSSSSSAAEEASGTKKVRIQTSLISSSHTI